MTNIRTDNKNKSKMKAFAVESLPPVSDMMKSANLEPKKQFGQNFLFDLNLTGRIAKSVPDIENVSVFEIGPGPGGLTRALLLAGAPYVVAIEKDTATKPILDKIESSAAGRLNVIYTDAMKFSDFAKYAHGKKVAICANLPYNIGTELLVIWLRIIAKSYVADKKSVLDSMTLMFQKEVAERIAAKVGDKQYGRLAVLTAMVADAKILFDVPNTAFVPRPKIQSSVVRIIPKISNFKIDDLEKIERLTAKLFGQRRKMIRGIMKDVDWERFGLSGRERAEELSPEKFAEIAKILD